MTSVSAHIVIRPAQDDDLPQLTSIYNYYVLNTPVTFDIKEQSVEERRIWFKQFALTGHYRLLVAAEGKKILAYAATTRFRPKAAYQTTVESSVYCAVDAVGQSLGTWLYRALFETISGEDINRIVAGITLPNPASEALHRRFGFKPVGVFSEIGRKFDQYWDILWMERPLRC